MQQPLTSRLINNAVSLSTVSLIEIKSPENDDNGSAVLARINAAVALLVFFESCIYYHIFQV